MLQICIDFGNAITTRLWNAGRKRKNRPETHLRALFDIVNVPSVSRPSVFSSCLLLTRSLRAIAGGIKGGGGGLAIPSTSVSQQL